MGGGGGVAMVGGVISIVACVHVQMKGIVKQGVRCKDCGISCHKHCKDLVVVDCSKRKEKKSKQA
jgi:hypothetical protein